MANTVNRMEIFQKTRNLSVPELIRSDSSAGEGHPGRTEPALRPDWLAGVVELELPESVRTEIRLSCSENFCPIWPNGCSETDPV